MNPSPDIALDIFDFAGRALKPHQEPANETTFAHSKIAATYLKISPGRSVLFYDCEKFGCKQEFLRFATVFTAAARVVNTAQPPAASLYQSLYQSATGCDMDGALAGSFPYEPMGGNLQLLAVANRLDMASWNGAVWDGAEIHFAYGSTSNTGVLIIVEFQLAPDRKTGFSRDSFKSLADAWAALSDMSEEDYPNALKNTLANSGIPLDAGGINTVKGVKVRVNHNLDGQNWQLTQLKLLPGTSAFVAALLDDQIQSNIAPADLTSLWIAAQNALQSGPSAYQIPFNFWEKPTLEYSKDPVGMGTPAGLCGSVASTRNVLALQQCTGCHTIESDTKFTHIANRTANASSVL